MENKEAKDPKTKNGTKEAADSPFSILGVDDSSTQRKIIETIFSSDR